MKKTLYTEVAYLIGIILLAFGTSLMTLGDLGLASIVSPAYILHVKISEFLPFFSFGTAEYTFQAFLLIILGLVIRKFKVNFLFSFVTAVLYGFVLDFFVWVTGFIPCDTFAVKLIIYSAGFVINTFSIAFLFHAYIPPEAYELFVIEAAEKFGIDKSKFKIGFDVACLIFSVALSFILFGFGEFVGVNIGTVITACLNGLFISFFCKCLEKHFEFKDKFPKFKAFLAK